MCFIFAREKSVSKTEGLSQCRRESKTFPPPPPFFSFGCRRFSSSSLRQKQDTKNIMSSLVASSLEWLLKRALRFVVHRFLGRVLKSEVRGNDARQIDLVDGGALARFLRRRPSSLSFFRAPSARCLFFFSLSLGSGRVG